MKVFVQVVDTKTGIYQSGMIDEQVQKGFEVKNAVEHFCSSDVEWEPDSKIDNTTVKVGRVKGTTKIVSVIL
ncbi:MAG: hypothetical protein J6S67_11550 [Methanobrevibacter sp.]|nr:hypothetical protein [Methanobrevibacter sp.]